MASTPIRRPAQTLEAPARRVMPSGGSSASAVRAGLMAQPYASAAPVAMSGGNPVLLQRASGGQAHAAEGSWMPPPVSASGGTQGAAAASAVPASRIMSREEMISSGLLRGGSTVLQARGEGCPAAAPVPVRRLVQPLETVAPVSAQVAFVPARAPRDVEAPVPAEVSFVPARAPRSAEELQRLRFEHSQRIAAPPAGAFALPEVAPSGSLGTERTQDLEQQLQEAMWQCKAQQSESSEALATADVSIRLLEQQLSQEAALCQQLREQNDTLQTQMQSQGTQVEATFEASLRQLQWRLADEAGRSQQLREENDVLQMQMRTQGAAAVQDATFELSRHQSRNSELEAQLLNAVARHGYVESQLASEAVASASLREELAEAQRQAMRSASPSRSQPSSPKSPTKAAFDLQRLESKCVDLEAQLLDAGASRKDMNAKLREKDDLVAALQKQVVAAREMARSDPTSTDGKLRQTDGVSAWLPNVLNSKKGLRRQLSSNTGEQLFQAAENDDLEALKTVFSEQDDPVDLVLNTLNDKRQTLLHIALSSGATEISQFILEQGSRWATQRKYSYELVGELLERETCKFVNNLDVAGRSPLATLCQRPEPPPEEVVMVLLQSQADPMQRDCTGSTPFLECARSGNTGMMRLLLDLTRGSVMLDSDDEHRSALHWGAIAGQKDSVELLLKAGADPEDADASGQTPVDAARASEKANEDVIKMLLEGVKDTDNDEEEGDDDRQRCQEVGESGDDEDDREAFLRAAQAQGMVRPMVPQGDEDWPDDEPDVADERDEDFNMPGLNGGSARRVGPGGVLRPFDVPRVSDAFVGAPDIMGPDDGMTMMADDGNMIMMTPDGPMMMGPDGQAVLLDPAMLAAFAGPGGMGNDFDFGGLDEGLDNLGIQLSRQT